MNMPTATYRIQFNPAFGFKNAQPVIAYLADLGVSDLYASPIFKSVKGSLHGYDVVDPNRLNPELGGLSDLAGLVAELMPLSRAGKQLNGGATVYFAQPKNGK